MRSRARWEIRPRLRAQRGARPNLEFRKMEKPAWQLESKASRRPRKRSQPCKRCAASARQRSSARSRSSFGLRSSDFLDERLETGLAAQGIEHSIELDDAELITTVTSLIRLFEASHRLLFFVQGEMK